MEGALSLVTYRKFVDMEGALSLVTYRKFVDMEGALSLVTYRKFVVISRRGVELYAGPSSHKAAVLLYDNAVFGSGHTVEEARRKALKTWSSCYGPSVDCARGNPTPARGTG